MREVTEKIDDIVDGPEPLSPEDSLFVSAEITRLEADGASRADATRIAFESLARRQKETGR